MAEKKEKKAKNIHEVKVEITGKDWEKKLFLFTKTSV